jgi:hypothetical protein
MSSRRLIQPCCIVMSIVCAGACSSPPEQTGVRIGDVTLEQFETGVTTVSWLVAVLGPPSSETRVEGVEDTSVLRYALGESTSGLRAFFSGKARKNTAVVYFVVTGGIVTRFWADREVERTLTGRAVQERSGEKAAE